MNYRKEFNEHMERTVNMALATSVDNSPNVRVVNFCYDAKKPGIIYFSTCRDNLKVEEFSKNINVALTTIPAEGIAHVRTRNAVVKKSTQSIQELKDLFLGQIPHFSKTLAEIGDELDVYEVHMKSAEITLGYDQQETFIF